MHTNAGCLRADEVCRHYNKRRNCTLWFWRVRISQIQTISQEQSNKGRSMRCVYMYTIIGFYINIIVGLSELLVSTNRAMREP